MEMGYKLRVGLIELTRGPVGPFCRTLCQSYCVIQVKKKSRLQVFKEVLVSYQIATYS